MSFFELASEESRYLSGLFLGGPAGHGLFRLAAHIAGRVAQHHDQGLVVHAGEYVVHAPACGAGYLPHKPEEAMGAFV